jgi:hypothetical protein
MSKEEDIAAAEAELAKAEAEPEDAPEPILNRAAPYGTVYPHGGKIRYYQDGKPFDFNGKLVKES